MPPTAKSYRYSFDGIDVEVEGLDTTLPLPFEPTRIDTYFGTGLTPNESVTTKLILRAGSFDEARKILLDALVELEYAAAHQRGVEKITEAVFEDVPANPFNRMYKAAEAERGPEPKAVPPVGYITEPDFSSDSEPEAKD